MATPPRDADAMATPTRVADVDFDPDAYADDADDADADADADDDATRDADDDARRAREDANDDFDATWRRATTAKRADVETFDEMLRDTLGDAIADARWERALMKIQRDARFRALKTHGERRAAFDAARRRAREEKKAAAKKRKAGRDDDDDVRARRARALRAREAEASERRRSDEREARFRKARLLDDEAEAAFTALCAERVKTYARTYDEAYERDLVGDPMGRDDVSRLRGGETRARALYEAHRRAVEASLKVEYEKLARRIIDKLVVREMSDENVATAARARRYACALDAVFDGALSYARAAEEEFELIDDVVFAFVSDSDKERLWTKCAIDILSRHGVKIDDDRVDDDDDVDVEVEVEDDEDARLRPTLR